MHSWLANHINNLRPDKFFLVVATIFGFIFIVLIPPFHNPDEPVHFFRVYQLSTFKILGETSRAGTQTTIPKSFIGAVQNNLSINGRQINFNPKVKTTFSHTISNFTQPLNESTKTITQFSSASAYSPTLYLPQTLIMWIDRLLNLSPTSMLYTMRIAGLSLYIGVIYFAIRILPYRKWTITLLALLPMSLAQASAVTADSSLISFLILFTALLLNMLNNKGKIQLYDKLLLSVATVLMGMSKQIFVIVSPLILLIPVNRFKSKLDWTRYVTLTLLAAFITFCLWSLLNPALNSSLQNTVAAQDAHARAIATIHFPIHLLKVMFNTYVGAGSDSLYSMFAGNFGWLDTPIPAWCIVLTLGVVGFCLVTDYENRKLSNSKYFDLSIIIVAAILFLCTSAIFYLYWTPTSVDNIQGLQGRYFIPIVMLLGFYQGRKLFKLQANKYTKLIVLIVPIILITSAVTIFERYYVN